MIANLTSSERQGALILAAVVALAGMAMAALGRADVLGVHGLIIMLFAGAVLFLIMSSFYDPEPTEDREASYYDDPIKAGIELSMAWAVFGMFMGVWVAAQLAWPDLAFDAAWSGFGRLRPTHTTGVIFGFGGNALIATSFHVVQRTSRARLAGQVSPGSSFSATISSAYWPSPAICWVSPSRRSMPRRSGTPTSGSSSSG